MSTPQTRAYFDPSQPRDAHGRWSHLSGAGFQERAAAHGAKLADLHGDLASSAATPDARKRHEATAAAARLQTGINQRALGDASAPSHEDLKRDMKTLERHTTALRIQVHHAKLAGKTDEVAGREAAFRHYQGIQNGLKAALKSGTGVHVVHHFGEDLPGDAVPAPKPAPVPAPAPDPPPPPAPAPAPAPAPTRPALLDPDTFEVPGVVGLRGAVLDHHMAMRGHMKDALGEALANGYLPTHVANDLLTDPRLDKLPPERLEQVRRHVQEAAPLKFQYAMEGPMQDAGLRNAYLAHNRVLAGGGTAAEADEAARRAAHTTAHNLSTPSSSPDGIRVENRLRDSLRFDMEDQVDRHVREMYGTPEEQEAHHQNMLKEAAKVRGKLLDLNPEALAQTRYKALEDKANGLWNDIYKVHDELEDQGLRDKAITDHPRIKKARQAYDRAAAAAVAYRAKNEDKYGNMHGRDLPEVRKLLAVKKGGTPLRLQKGSDGPEWDVQPGADWIRDHVDSPHAHSAFTRVSTSASGRAHCDVMGIAMHKTKEKQSVVVHELGHWLERRDPVLAARAHAFLEKRIAGKPLVKLKDLYPDHGYDDHEVTHAGAFNWPKNQAYADYTAKSYLRPDGTRRATEIMSMGLEWMHKNPAEFARTDPEFFDFIYAASRGVRR